MFFDAFDKDEFSRLGDEHIEEYFWEKVPCEKSFYSFNVLKDHCRSVRKDNRLQVRIYEQTFSRSGKNGIKNFRDNGI